MKKQAKPQAGNSDSLKENLSAEGLLVQGMPVMTRWKDYHSVIHSKLP
ncbi:MAG: hypothetical protein KKH97_09045 [Proteobacteria bacterium]|nr:hypothetical protein [Pseudomonadota bacterium]MBU1712482.1 hypothetical protein [Pseudomonadota bacterium]